MLIQQEEKNNDESRGLPYEINLIKQPNKNVARKAMAKIISDLHDQRKETELCQFWSAEFLKDQTRITAEYMNKHCKKEPSN